MITNSPIGRIRLSRQTLAAWAPPDRIPSFEWICEHSVTKRGEPFDPYAYPWTRGICQSWDDPACERLFFQAGSRLGKTELGLSLLLYGIATDPDVAMIGGPTEDKIKQWILDRFVPMAQGCWVTRNWVPPAHRRSKTKLQLRHGIIYGAWSGSPTTLGDLDPRYLFGFEVSKFSKAASEEADSLRLLLERGSEIPDRRVYCESTPTITGKCRINHHLRNGTNARFHVPCPHCGKFQQLIKGTGKPGEGGVVWDKDGEHSDPNLAYKTARYVCKFCNREIDEAKRLPMVEKGVWCPKGCMIDRAGRRRGKPENDGPDHSFQISRLYGPTFTFGRYARAYVDAIRDPDTEAYRSFLNNWEGICWTPHYAMQPWEQIAERLCLEDIELRKCPEETQFITIGVDVQIDHWVYVVCGWTAKERGTVINYGLSHSWAELTEVIRTEYPHADDGPALHAIYTLIDARDGTRTDEVTGFCKTINEPRGPWVLPCMGGKQNALKGKAFTKTQLDAGGKMTHHSKRRGLVGFELITVGTNYYQSWIHNCLDRRNPEDPASIVFPSSARYDQDLFDQLMAERPEWKVTTSGQDCFWVKQNEKDVNDFRDALRYAKCAADVYVGQNWNRVGERRVLSKKIPPKKQEVAGRATERKQRKGQTETTTKRPKWVRKMKVGR